MLEATIQTGRRVSPAKTPTRKRARERMSDGQMVESPWGMQAGEDGEAGRPGEEIPIWSTM